MVIYTQKRFLLTIVRTFNTIFGSYWWKCQTLESIKNFPPTARFRIILAAKIKLTCMFAWTRSNDADNYVSRSMIFFLFSKTFGYRVCFYWYFSCKLMLLHNSSQQSCQSCQIWHLTYGLCIFIFYISLHKPCRLLSDCQDFQVFFQHSNNFTEHVSKIKKK